MHACAHGVFIIRLHGCCAAAESGEKNDCTEHRKQNGSHKLILVGLCLLFAIEQAAERLSRKLLRILRRKISRQIAPANFPPLVRRNLFYEKNLLGHLPAAQAQPAKL